ncbi:MAG: NYN domain-containing protein [Phycisphaeraceae bacterium]
MALIIDAYNVLHCTHVLPDWCAIHCPAHLCLALESSRFAHQRCVVVCDGAPKPLDIEYTGPVELRYSGHASDADTVIEQLIDADHSPRRLIVVSNDRRLMTAARRRRARSMTSEAFLHLLVTPSKRDADHDAKPTVVPNPDYWLEQFQLDPDAPPPPESEPEHEPDIPPSRGRAIAPPRVPPSNDIPSTSGGPRPGESEIDYWLREFGFTDGEEKI